MQQLIMLTASQCISRSALRTTRSMCTSPARSALPARRVLRVRGADAVGFLNGFSTQEFSRLGQEGAIFSAFLNSKGRTVFDAVALAAGRDGAFDTTSIFLDVAAESAEQALQHLRRYRLRADVKLADVSHKFAAVTLLGRGQGSSVTDEAQSMAQAVACIAADTSEAKFARQTCAMPDPRSDVMGLKAIVPVAALEALQASGAHGQLVSGDEYGLLRWLAGVPEGGECEGYMPLEWGVDYLRGASFSKGCYLGQELMARTRFKGQVRKRAVPVAYTAMAGAPAPLLRPPSAGPWRVAAAAAQRWDIADAQALSRPPPEHAMPSLEELLACGKSALGRVEGGGLTPPAPGTGLATEPAMRSPGRVLSAAVNPAAAGAVLGFAVIKNAATAGWLGDASGGETAGASTSITAGETCLAPYLSPPWHAIAADELQRA